MNNASPAKISTDMLDSIRWELPMHSRTRSKRLESLSFKTADEVYSADSQPSQREPSEASFLDLPVDILSLITKYLLLSDLISLSLTTKLLRHLCPSPKVHPLELGFKAEAKCFARIHLRFLPPAPVLAEEKPAWNSIFSRVDSPKCPYCSHIICSPNCTSALFLDAATGIFFPGSLYNIPKAKFKYSPEYISTRPQTQPPSMFKLLSTERRSEAFVYSTIWCAHHRCPRNLLISDTNSKRQRAGAKVFLEEYMQLWGELRYLIRTKSPCSTIQWSTWAKDLVGYELTMQPIRGGAEYGTRPVYEYSFYEAVCKHCRLVCKDTMIGSTVFEVACSCSGRTTDLGLGGCRRCGLVSTKFEVVEVFSGDDRKLAVATEWKEGSGGRLEPINRDKRAKQLEIVRGRKLIEVAEKARIGIMDLPAGVLRKIMEFVACQSKGTDYQPYEMLRVSYLFAKLWYGQEFYGCCKRFEALEMVIKEKVERGKIGTDCS